jgi:hypothetical protein
VSDNASQQAEGLKARALAALRRYPGWTVLIIAAVAYYPRFIDDPLGMVLYPEGAACLLNGEPLLPCSPTFTYPPAFALFMTPFVPLPLWLRNLVWYLISIAAAVTCARLSEKLVQRLYPTATNDANIGWLRGLSLLLSLKFILAVFEYQSYDLLLACLMLTGLWSLANRRDMTAGAALAMAAALKAMPLIFLPYLLLKRRFAAAAVFLLVFVVVCLLPDAFSALRGMKTDYLLTWIRQVAGPALTPGGSSAQHFWTVWMGPYLNNQSLRGVVTRLVTDPVFGKQILLVLYALTAAAVGGLLIASARRDEFIGVDGAILLIAMLALAPITSRYHFVFLILPYTILVAAFLCDRRTRLLGGGVLLASFILLTGTSNDLTGNALAEFAYTYGFLIAGALVLLIYLGLIILARRPQQHSRALESTLVIAP